MKKRNRLIILNNVKRSTTNTCYFVKGSFSQSNSFKENNSLISEDKKVILRYGSSTLTQFSLNKRKEEKIFDFDEEPKIISFSAEGK